MSKSLVDGIYADHGSAWTYRNHGCRCDACKRAWNAWHHAYNHRTGRHVTRAAYVAAAKAEAVARDNHGTETRYCYGCRCDACREASREARARRRARVAA